MKLSTFVLAFIVSTTIHVGALTSNLLHVNAESALDNKVRAVKLHIVPSTIRKPSAPLPESAEKKIEKSRTADSEINNGNKAEPLEDPSRDMPTVKTSRIALPEKQSLADKPSNVKLPVYRDESPDPDHAMSLPEKTLNPPPAVTTHSMEQFQDSKIKTTRPIVPAVYGREDETCDGCTASISSAYPLVPKRLEMGRSEIGPTTPAIITLSSKPTYPRYSRLHKEEGITVLSVEILPDGKLGNVQVVQSSGYRRLDQAAVKGMQKAELVPALKDGSKVASVKRISIKFDLEDWGE